MLKLKDLADKTYYQFETDKDAEIFKEFLKVLEKRMELNYGKRIILSN